jgi:hypothetical protein
MDLPMVEKSIPAILINYDNQTVITKVKNSQDNIKSTNHVKRRLKSIRKLRSFRVIAMDYIQTTKNLADPFTNVAEPPKLYGPHAPIIVSKTSNGYARVPDNLKSLSGVLGKPESSTFYNSHRIHKGVTTTLQYLLQNFTSECGRI